MRFVAKIPLVDIIGLKPPTLDNNILKLSLNTKHDIIFSDLKKTTTKTTHYSWTLKKCFMFLIFYLAEIGEDLITAEISQDWDEMPSITVLQTITELLKTNFHLSPQVHIHPSAFGFFIQYTPTQLYIFCLFKHRYILFFCYTDISLLN